MRRATPRSPIEPRPRRQPGSLRWLSGALAAMALAVAMGAGPASAGEPWPGPDYRATRAGHPLRIAAYLIHPIGVALDYAIMRPAYWVGQREPWRTVFGVRH